MESVIYYIYIFSIPPGTITKAIKNHDKNQTLRIMHSCLNMTLPIDRSNLDKLPPINTL